MFLRLLHITHTKKASNFLKIVLDKVVTYSRIYREQLFALIWTAYLICLTVHFSVVLWMITKYKEKLD